MLRLFLSFTYQVPRYVIDQLKVSLDDYGNFQRKCMMYLLSAKEIFRNNSLVNSLESKFLCLIKKSNDFVSNELNGQSRNETLSREIEKNLSQRSMSENKFSEIQLSNDTGKKKKETELDDDFFLSEQDLNYIDYLSMSSDKANVNSSTLFNSMESQSKSLTLTTGKSPSAFKTPAGETVFKVHLDATIPSFNLGLENENGDNVIATSVNGRPVRERKIANIMKSPFVDRWTSIHGKTFKKEETDLWNWLHANDRHPK